MTDTVEIAKPNMETVSALAPEETERLGGEILRRRAVAREKHEVPVHGIEVVGRNVGEARARSARGRGIERG